MHPTVARLTHSNDFASRRAYEPPMIRQTAHEFFDEWSDYDRVLDHNYMFHDEIYRDVGRVLAERYGERPFAVLDLGCGSARHFSRALAGRTVNCYAGYDLSEVALAHAAKNLAPFGCAVELQQGDLLEGLKRGSDGFDLIFCSFSLHHLDGADKANFFQLARRRLNANGILLLIDTMREDDEDRPVYLDRYCAWIAAEWSALGRAEIERICRHIRGNDFPETAAEIDVMAVDAGFRPGREVNCFRWHRTRSFEQNQTTVRIREAKVNDAVAIAQVHVDSWRATYRGILPDAHLGRFSREARERTWRNILTESARREFVYVAVDATDAIVGFASGGPERVGDPKNRAEIYAIYLLETFQRRGIGRRLCHAVAERLVEAGFDSMVIWVLEKNPARGFYSALGGKVVAEKAIAVDGVSLVEVGYGWEDVRALLRSAPGRDSRTKRAARSSKRE
jgi:SAM-dependent methyltransferase